MKKCPMCKSSDIGFNMAGIDGKYKCNKCNYIGPIIIEEYEIKTDK